METLKALAAAQAELLSVPKTAEAKMGSYSYRYATLADTLAVVRPVLSRHGLCIVQDVTFDGSSPVSGPSVTTIIIHVDGGCLKLGPLTCPADIRDSRSIGSAITYARRYSLLAALGIAADDDDDGEAAKAPQPSRGKPTGSNASEPQQPDRETVAVFEKLKALDPADQAKMSRFASRNSRGLKMSDLSDPAWRGEVEAYMMAIGVDGSQLDLSSAN